jgi:hypothetical protein
MLFGEDFFRRTRRQVPSISIGIARVLPTTSGGKKTAGSVAKVFGGCLNCPAARPRGIEPVLRNNLHSAAAACGTNRDESDTFTLNRPQHLGTVNCKLPFPTCGAPKPHGIIRNDDGEKKGREIVFVGSNADVSERIGLRPRRICRASSAGNGTRRRTASQGSAFFTALRDMIDGIVEYEAAAHR